MSAARTAMVAAGAGLVVVGVVAVVGIVASPRTVPYETTVVLREGWTMFDHAAALEAAGVVPAREFLAQCRDPAFVRSLGIPADDAEGYLFPDTYRFRVPTAAAQVVSRLVRTWQTKVGRLLDARRTDVAALGARLGTDGEHAVIVLASLIESEVRVDAERPLVAAVLWNRLTKRDPEVTRLQVDPTAAYGCLRLPWLASCAGRNGRAVTRTMLDDDANPYNTYRHDDLPPGPIGNPGLASVRAVLDRPASPYLFYVSRGDGTHAFSRTYAEHRRAVARFRGRNGGAAER